MTEKRSRVELSGIGVSPGIAVGRVFVIDRRKQKHPKYHVSAAGIETEIQRSQKAIDVSVEALRALAKESEHGSTEEPIQILTAHILMLQDPLLHDTIKKEIRANLKCAEWAIVSAVKIIRNKFEKLGNAYFRERRSDVDFIGDQILAAMKVEQADISESLPKHAVVVGYDISPADILALLNNDAKAIVTQVGGKTSHTAILAHAMEIPAIVGCADVIETAGIGDEAAVNGDSGKFILFPTAEEKQTYARESLIQRERDQAILGESHLPAISPDGKSTRIMANIDLDAEVDSAVTHGASGIGLFRTEYLFMNRKTIPTVEDHLSAYTNVIDRFGEDADVVFRTFDLGSDKLSALLPNIKEENPALGLRACRLGLQHPELLRSQIRALLLATAGKRGSIMFPMISGLLELRQVKSVLREEMDRLESENIPFWREVPVGIMVELPSAIVVSDLLAQECDFFCVGTNDLIQYALAIDRNNEKLSYLYRPLHPSILRMLKTVIRNAHDAQIPVSLCGEMAADPLCIPICFGLGFDSLSVPIASVARVKWFRREYPQARAEKLLDEVMALDTCDLIETRVLEELKEQKLLS
jgi:phosphoenolpyruvate-protein phosphotransferase (PTS system enzyme I)